MLLMIDNYDSFTYNIAQYLNELGAETEVYRNDAINVDKIAELNPSHLVISPGPCTPNEAGISVEAIKTFAGQLPILGVCLGHQAIGQAFGGEIVRAERVMHGKTSPIYHDNVGVFTDLMQAFQATRYHSLVIEDTTVPDCLEITAWTEQQNKKHEIMGVRHREFDIQGVQFHPESILTEQGHQLLENFLQGR